MPIIHCPSCKDPVEIDADWYGRRIACPNCDHKFTPRRGGRDDRDDESDDRPRRSRDRDDDREDRPRRRRRSYDDGPPKKGNAVLWIVLGAVGIPMLLVCVGCIGFVMWAGTAKETFAGPWSDHAAGPNAEVTASFPKTPTKKFLNVFASTGGELVGFHNQDDGNAALDATFAVGYFDFPAGTPDPLASHYTTIRQEVEEKLVQPFGPATVIREGATTMAGYPAKEAEYAEEDGGYILRVVHITDRPPGSPARLVVIVAGGLGLKPEDKQKFLNSVKIGKR